MRDAGSEHCSCVYLIEHCQRIYLIEQSFAIDEVGGFWSLHQGGLPSKLVYEPQDRQRQLARVDVIVRLCAYTSKTC